MVACKSHFALFIDLFMAIFMRVKTAPTDKLIAKLYVPGMRVWSSPFQPKKD